MVKFLILGSGRCGSTLVAKSLDEHPNLRVGGELFHFEEAERCRAFHALNKTYPPGQHETEYYHDGDDAAQFLERAVFYERPWNEIRAYGFKFFYIHARANPQEKKAWEYLLNHKDIRVIHIVRVNLLKTFLSLRLACVTGEWKRWANATTPRQEPEPINLDPQRCQEYFGNVLAQQQWARKSFSAHPFLEISYEEDIFGRFQAAMNQIQDFLGVPPVPMRQLLEKQAKRSPREMIVNYDELKEHFRYTLYEDFFVS